MKARENGYGYIQGAYKATFVGFYPVENPQVVLLVVMDDPQTSIYGGMGGCTGISGILLSVGWLRCQR